MLQVGGGELERFEVVKEQQRGRIALGSGECLLEVVFRLLLCASQERVAGEFDKMHTQLFGKRANKGGLARARTTVEED